MAENKDALSPDATQGEDTPRSYIYAYPGMHDYEGMVLPDVFPNSSVEEVKHFPFQASDIVISTYPRSGTSWLQEIVWLLYNDADTSRASEAPINKRVPNIDAKFTEESIATILSRQQPPRLIKTHLPCRIYSDALHNGSMKLIYGIRNPKDMLVSYHNFYKMMKCFGDYTGPFNQFLDMFYNKELGYGDWFDHVLAYWEMRDLPNVLILKYEDMQKDPHKAVQQVAEFCQRVVTQDQIESIVKHTSFGAMQANKQTNFTFLGSSMIDSNKSKYMRKGTVGDWKNHFTVAQSEQFDAMYNQKMDNSGLSIDFEL